MLFGASGVSLLGNLLRDKGTIRGGEGTIKAVECAIRAVQGHPLTNFEIQKYY